MCECGDLVCFDELTVAREAYAGVRRHPTRFVLARGHDDPAFERIVSSTAAYLVVQKPLSRN